VALTMPVLVPMNMSFGSHCALHLMPGWADVLKQPLEDAKAALRDPEVRRRMDEAAHSDEAGIFRRLADWDLYRVGDTFTPGTEHHQGRMIGDIAVERGISAFDALVEVVLEDDLRTILWPTPPEDDEASWALRAELWTSGQAMLGGSDAGAHLDRMLGSTYPTQLIGDCLRGRKLIPVEEAVRLLTDQPARLFGLRERGRIAEGWHADLVLLDPDEIGSGPPRTLHDLPAGGPRLFADSFGVRRVLVNGVTTVLDGQPTGALPGTVLRSGRDTETVLP
jgi:N-acyl-D-aspartate/D-glutamate deacylase